MKVILLLSHLFGALLLSEFVYAVKSTRDSKTTTGSAQTTATRSADYDYAANQLPDYKATTKGPVGVLTTAYGEPVEYKDATDTSDINIFENHFYLDAATHLNRERVPERAVHAKGFGAFGYFEVTKDVTEYIRSKFLQKIGKKTPVAIRFSSAFQDKGAPDVARDGRGMAVKFYTEEGNLDFVCINAPTFGLVDPVNVVSFGHVNKRNPVTNLHDPNAQWDFITRLPEQLNTLIYVVSDNGIPDGVKNMDAFPVHTYEVENNNGDLYYVRFNFINNQGSKFLLNNESRSIALSDPDYYTRDLYNTIARGAYPSWTLNMQVMTFEETQKATFDPFSVNKYWPKELYPYLEVGKLVINKNPTNWFAQMEQAAFTPGHLVPGINGGVDSIFVARSFVYKDSQYHRIGPNFLDLPVNRALNKLYILNRDGYSNSFDIYSGPNYYPNSFNGPEPYVFNKRNNKTLVGKAYPKVRRDTDLFGQTTAYYLSQSKESRMRIAQTLAFAISIVTVPEIQAKALKLFGDLHPELGENVSVVLAALAAAK